MITKEQLGTFDSVEIFSESYLKVRKGDLYNLIDKNGKWLTEWCESIEKSNGGGINIKKQSSSSSSNTMRQYASVESVRRADEVERLLSNTSVLADLDIDDVVVLESPYRLSCDHSVEIVAKVRYMGEDLLLSSNGILYYENGSKYDLPKFSVSYTDLNRIHKKVNHLNFVLNTEFKNTEKKTSSVKENMERLQSAWAFGFDGGNKCYSLGAKHSVILPTETPWGQDSIKLRIMEPTLQTISGEQFKAKAAKLGFKSGFCKTETPIAWWTKEYSPTDLQLLFDDLEKLSSLSFYTNEG